MEVRSDRLSFSRPECRAMAVRTSRSSAVPWLGAVWAVALLVASRGAHAQQSSYFSNLPGSYCANRADPCCRFRLDDCSAPIMGTLCYCDEFCNRAYNPDCCPDYEPVCLGVKPPEPQLYCDHNGQRMEAGETIQDNCNSCTCLGNAQVSCSTDKCLTDPDLLGKLPTDNSAEGNRWITWTATNYSMFWGRKLKDGMLQRTGTKLPSINMYPISLYYDAASIPKSFDARQKWQFKISRPRDQGWCGSSWAFSTATVATDRLAIESNGTEAVPLSPQHLISCDRLAEQSCAGGTVVRAWQYLRRHGVASEQCYPYTSGNTGVKGKCEIPPYSNFTTLNCDVKPQKHIDREALYHTEPAYRISSKESDIQYEIMTDGPVQAMMRVNQEFFYYNGGVYSSTGHDDPQDAGYHSVRLIGWGEEFSNFISGPVKYWLAINSWGTQWGEEGLFKIRRGVNESGIEENILTVRAGLLVYYPPQYEGSISLQDYPEWFFQ